MTKAQVRRAAQSIFEMRVNRVTRLSQSDLNTRRMAIRKKIEDRQFNSILATLARDELAAGSAVDAGRAHAGRPSGV